MRQEMTTEEKERLAPQLEAIRKAMMGKKGLTDEGIELQVVRTSKWGLEASLIKGLTIYGKCKFNVRTRTMTWVI